MSDKLEMLKRLAFIMFGSGVALIGEHIVSRGELTLEVFGHETYGILLIILSYISFIVISTKQKMEKKQNA